MKNLVEFMKHDGGKVAVRPSDVIAVSDSSYCPGRCNIYVLESLYYLVIGNYDEVMKKLFSNE